MKKRIVFAIGTAMLAGLVACTANVPSTETEKEPDLTIQSEPAAENEAPDEQKRASGNQQKGLPADGEQPDGQTKHGKRGENGQLPADGTQPDGQTKHGKRSENGQLPADGTQPDGITGATPKSGSDRGKRQKQKKGTGENGSLTIVEPTETPAEQPTESTVPAIEPGSGTEATD